MKRILACIFTVTLISTAAFSKNFFSQRFFEIKVGADVDVSNNLFAANDYLKKDLVIDLRKIADECPEEGFNLRADAAPKLEINLNVAGVTVGLASGLEIYESMNLDKGLFNFLGYGNSVGETISFAIKNDADVFAYTQATIGFGIGNLRITAKPALFMPIVSVRGGGGSVKVLNDSEGNLKANLDINMDVYSAIELKADKNNQGITFDTEKLQSFLMKGYGFDLGGGVTVPLSKSFCVDATCRIPIVPGHLNFKSNIQGGYGYDMKITDYQNAKETKRDIVVSSEETSLAINRPMKINVYLDKNLLGTLFNARAGGGFGIRRPFSDEAVFYPEYYLGFTINLIDMIKVGVSTAYKDQLFVHQLGTTLNIRLVQVDLGVSSQSSNFKKSFAVPGVGAYAYVTVGF